MDDINGDALETAVALWTAGEEIPLDLAVELMMEGYDVEALEAAHRR